MVSDGLSGGGGATRPLQRDGGVETQQSQGLAASTWWWVPAPLFERWAEMARQLTRGSRSSGRPKSSGWFISFTPTSKNKKWTVRAHQMREKLKFVILMMNDGSCVSFSLYRERLASTREKLSYYIISTFPRLFLLFWLYVFWFVKNIVFFIISFKWWMALHKL